jgi:hypothetical protein
MLGNSVSPERPIASHGPRLAQRGEGSQLAPLDSAAANAVGRARHPRQSRSAAAEPENGVVAKGLD